MNFFFCKLTPFIVCLYNHAPTTDVALISLGAQGRRYVGLIESIDTDELMKTLQ
jgi:hypothetical protein